MAPKRKPRGAAASKAASQPPPEPDLSQGLSVEYLSTRDKLVEELHQQVEERKQHIRQLAADAILALKQEHHVLMLTLPEEVLSMPLKEYKASGGVVEALLQERGAPEAAVEAAPATATRGRRGRTPGPSTVQRTTRKGAASTAVSSQGVEATPAMAGHSAPFTPAAPGTIQRAPQMGEIFYSARGSPLGMYERDPSTQQGVLNTVLRGGQYLQSAMPTVAPDPRKFATILKRPQAGSKTAAVDAIMLTTSDGTSVEVDCQEKLKALPKQQQKEVTADLEAMSKRIDALLGRGGTIAARRRR